MAECGTPYLDCINKPESPESIFKRLISVDAEGNLSLNICGCECGGGTGGGVVSVTYAELVALIGSSGLTAGGWYLLTDFATVNYLVDDVTPLADINTGATEPLLILATDINKIDSRVYSPTYPQDVINYDWDPANYLADYSFSIDAINIITGWKGVITYRWDTTLDNYCGYDFRNVKFRRWALNPDTWDNGTTYAAKEIVKNVAGTRIYISLQGTNLNHAVTDTAWWTEIVDMSTNKYWAVLSTVYRNITVDPLDYQDFYTFNGGTCYMNHIGTCHDNGNDWSYSGSMLNNIVFGSGCYNNEMSVGCYRSSIGKNFYNNKIGNPFNDNQIGNSFHDNTIGNNFASNVIGSLFSFNLIGNEFAYNVIGPGCKKNSIGNYFVYNTIGDAFEQNIVMNEFSTNIIKNNFKYNNILNTTTAIDFTAASHVYGTYNCIIQTRQDGVAKLSYINNSDVLTIVNATA